MPAGQPHGRPCASGWNRSGDSGTESFNRITQRLNSIEGRLGNLDGKEYERSTRTKALARVQINLGFETPHIALQQDGLTDPRLTGAVARALRDGTIEREEAVDLFEADLIISTADNRHAVMEISVTAGEEDVRRAMFRAGVLARITGGDTTAAIITSHLPDPQREQAEAEGVTVFLVS